MQTKRAAHYTALEMFTEARDFLVLEEMYEANSGGSIGTPNLLRLLQHIGSWCVEFPTLSDPAFYCIPTSTDPTFYYIHPNIN